MKKIIGLLLFTVLVSAQLYSQPGPGTIGLFVYDKSGASLALPKDIHVFSQVLQSKFKSDAVNYLYQEKPCQGGRTVICASIIIESPVNIVSVINKNDTMNLVVKDYLNFGYELLLDSVVFNKGWYEIKNENKRIVTESKPWGDIDNKMHLVADSCFSSFARVSKKYIVPAVAHFPDSFTNKPSPANEREIIDIMVDKAVLLDSAGAKYVKCIYQYDGKVYSNTFLLLANLKIKPSYRVVVSFKKEDPKKILSIRSYPNGY